MTPTGYQFMASYDTLAAVDNALEAFVEGNERDPEQRPSVDAVKRFREQLQDAAPPRRRR